MGKIKKLSSHEAQKIAAGEVVERPANVVKELVENSIDAGAQTIAIYIKQGGQSFIRVVDDGCGMSEDDAALCFEHHATSKITTVNDLETLASFGFRGEALASICAVSTVILLTKEKDAEHGIKIKRNGQTVIEQTAIACASGTDITIENLFFNVPVRKKFLKTAQTELRHITQLFYAFCFAYPHLHFILYSEDKELYACPPVKILHDRVAQLWEPTAIQHIYALNAQEKNITINGVISDQTWFHYDRNHIFFFVNKRWIKNHQLVKALLKGYGAVLPPGKFPAAIINIDIDPKEVDINIHPRKQELQFLHPIIVERSIQEQVKKILEQGITKFIPPQQFKTRIPTESFVQPFGIPHKSIYSSTITQHPSIQHTTTHNPLASSLDTVISPLQEKQITTFMQEQSTINKTYEDPGAAESITVQEHAYHYIGQLQNTYLLLEVPEGLFIIDQHAAHERILYEQFKNRFDVVTSTALLFPEVISCSSVEYAFINKHLDLIKTLGIGIELFGAQQFIIQSIPVHLKTIPIKELITAIMHDIAEDNVHDETLFKKQFYEKAHAQMACKAAIKAGDIVSDDQVRQLLKDLYQTDNRLTCPHGRPNGWLLSTYEIEKKFKRKK